MYLGVMNVISSWYITLKIPHLDRVFTRIARIDRDITKLLGNKEKIHSTERIQFRFEIICMIALTIWFIISIVFTIWTYPE